MRKRSPEFLKQARAILSVISTAAVMSFCSACPLSLQAQTLPGPDMSEGGQIDIQANEQEFIGDHMIARGNVHVTYKGTVIDAPMATLYKDPAGKPQRAVFTGHPYLRQGLNKVDADVLTFELASQTIIADGNAHSEVLQNDAAGATKVGKDKGAKKQKDAQADATSSDTAPEEGADKTAGDGASGSAASASSSKAGKDKSEGAAKSGEKQQAPEKIITDSDRQEFNRNTGKFEAFGHVRVKHGDIVVNSNKLQLVYGTDNKPESAVFTGKVVATQQQNRTEADMITYFLSTKRIQATGNVRSKVVQQKKADATKKGGLFSGLSVPTRGEANTQTASNSQSATDTIIIWSDAQDYSEGTGRVEADGNVKLFYEDTVGVAPKVILVRNPKDGQAEKVVMSGRCQITQPGKRWIADRITFTMADNRVLAEGNTKAFILQKPSPGRAPEPQRDGFKVAGEKPTRLGATKIETAQ